MNDKYICETLWKCSAYEIVMFVHELHKRGYEQMRLYAGMSPTGMSWRWFIYPKVLMKKDKNFERKSYGPSFECVYGSTNEDIPHDREMINFVDVINEIESYVNLSKGEDKEYVEWFKSIVEHAEEKDFPIAFSEFFNENSWKFMSGELLPYPPY